MNTTCHEIGSVMECLPQNKVKITVSRTEACGHCAARGSCQTLGGPSKNVVMTLNNTVGAQVGDRVRISMAERHVVKASAVLYLIPALCLLAGAFAGAQNGENTALVGSLGGLTAGFLLTFLIGRKMEQSGQVAPLITDIVEQSPHC